MSHIVVMSTTNQTENLAENKITLDLSKAPTATSNFLLSKASEWDCSPNDALTRIMDILATEQPQPVG